MRNCKSMAMLLTVICLVLTAMAGFAAAPGNPGVAKIPEDQKVKPNFAQITVVSPKSGDIWMGGDNQGSRHISWTYTSNIGNTFNLALQKGKSIVYKFPGDVSGNGSGKAEAWVKIPHSVTGGDDYQVVVTSKGNPDIKGVSAVFALRNLKIASPQGGVVWYKGDSHNITWTYSGTFGPKVYIWLFSEDLAVVKRIGEAFISDRYYAWKISPDIARRKDYKILINNNASYLMGGDWMDITPNKFTVAEYVK